VTAFSDAAPTAFREIRVAGSIVVYGGLPGVENITAMKWTISCHLELEKGRRFRMPNSVGYSFKDKSAGHSDNVQLK
jgi:hypothetical protein